MALGSAIGTGLFLQFGELSNGQSKRVVGYIIGGIAAYIIMRAPNVGTPPGSQLFLALCAGKPRPLAVTLPAGPAAEILRHRRCDRF